MQICWPSVKIRRAICRWTLGDSQVFVYILWQQSNLCDKVNLHKMHILGVFLEMFVKLNIRIGRHLRCFFYHVNRFCYAGVEKLQRGKKM